MWRRPDSWQIMARSQDPARRLLLESRVWPIPHIFFQLLQPLHVSAQTWSYGQRLTESLSLENLLLHGKNTCRKQMNARKLRTSLLWLSVQRSGGRYTIFCHLKLAAVVSWEPLCQCFSTSLVSPRKCADSGYSHRYGPSWRVYRRYQSGVALWLAPVLQ